MIEITDYDLLGSLQVSGVGKYMIYRKGSMYFYKSPLQNEFVHYSDGYTASIYIINSFPLIKVSFKK